MYVSRLESGFRKYAIPIGFHVIQKMIPPGDLLNWIYILQIFSYARPYI